ncbi:MAG: UDP-N-acetylmuramoyl-L-alanyl-D-glutamate--2,6-diaminopimelate ligase [Bifidobacteriaceae bacterium]|jgi:UDP-N-acetylmuramoyl-L-alanyl-D-glutamate--2,6-diaminopimelate ligase|nr:UDP-N-acetylmuramoyl-L-alanyl-D-glutamate--2,6-diaminopimelate ligase [Bifidobacteriaceae bacterium]
MKLNKLIKTNLDIEINGVTTYSKNTDKGFLFLCIKGSKTDRHLFIEDAAKRGAAAAIIDDKKYENSSIPTILVDNVNDIYDSLIAKFYDNPQEKISLIAITGTDGKTTTAAMVEQLIDKEVCANFGTNGAFFNGKRYRLNNTTPDSEAFYPLLAQFVKEGAKAAVIEFSSESEHFGRLKDLKFDIIALTNITSDHLNTHKTLKNYVNAKLNIFKNHLKIGGIAILNSSTKNFDRFKSEIEGNLSPLFIISFGYKNDDTFKIKEIKEIYNRIEITFDFHNQTHEKHIQMLGKFNAYNYITALAIQSALYKIWSDGGKNKKYVKDYTHSYIKFSIPGRANKFDTKDGISVIIDYAHTLNSIDNILEASTRGTLRKIIAVTGAAGDRDKSKRPKIAKLLEEKADKIIFTTDDPHFEKPENIINDLLSGIQNRKKVRVIPDRGKAINAALKIAELGDTILILGKGDDDYIIVEDEKIPFNDIEFIKNAFSKLNITYI